MKTSRQKVDDAIGFTSSYIASVIRSGSLEVVCIPYFGKFEGKLKHAGVMDLIRSTPKPIYNGDSRVTSPLSPPLPLFDITTTDLTLEDDAII